MTKKDNYSLIMILCQVGSMCVRLGACVPGWEHVCQVGSMCKTFSDKEGEKGRGSGVGGWECEGRGSGVGGSVRRVGAVGWVGV